MHALNSEHDQNVLWLFVDGYWLELVGHSPMENLSQTTTKAILHLYTGAVMRELTVEQSEIPASKQIKSSPVN